MKRSNISLTDITKDFIFSVDRLIRENIYKTQGQIAEEIDWNNTGLSFVMNEKRNVPFEFAYRLAELIKKKNLSERIPYLAKHYSTPEFRIVKDHRRQTNDFIGKAKLAVERGYFKSLSEIEKKLGCVEGYISSIEKGPYGVDPGIAREFSTIYENIERGFQLSGNINDFIKNYELRLIALEAATKTLRITAAELKHKVSGEPLAKVLYEMDKAIEDVAQAIFSERKAEAGNNQIELFSNSSPHIIFRDSGSEPPDGR